METTIKHALSQATAADMVDVLLNEGMHPRQVDDISRGQIIAKWLSEGDNISEFSEVYDGFGREYLTMIAKFAGIADFETAGKAITAAIGQAPYGENILDLIVKQVERENEIKKALA